MSIDFGGPFLWPNFRINKNISLSSKHFPLTQAGRWVAGWKSCTFLHGFRGIKKQQIWVECSAMIEIVWKKMIVRIDTMCGFEKCTHLNATSNQYAYIHIIKIMYMYIYMIIYVSMYCDIQWYIICPTTWWWLQLHGFRKALKIHHFCTWQGRSLPRSRWVFATLDLSSQKHPWSGDKTIPFVSFSTNGLILTSWMTNTGKASSLNNRTFTIYIYFCICTRCGCTELPKKVDVNAYTWIISVEKLDVMYIDSSMGSSCTISFNIYMVLCQPQHHPLSSMVLCSLYTVHLHTEISQCSQKKKEPT